MPFRHFIALAAVLLIGWLAISFFHTLPPKRTLRSTNAESPPLPTSAMKEWTSEKETWTVSVSP